MCGFEDNTIGGFNSTIEKQKVQDGKVYVSTVLSSNCSEVIHDRADINKIEPMTRNDYRAGGCTALLDAIGGAIRYIGNVHKHARPEDVPEHTIFIITDGTENASRRYTSAEIKAKIKRQTERYGRDFIFLAANIDAVETAEDIGIHRARAANYRQIKRSVNRSYHATSEAITAIRADEADYLSIADFLMEDDNES